MSRTNRPVFPAVALSLCAALGAACSDAPAAPDVPPSDDLGADIVGGASDRGRDAAVVAIDVGGRALCTGTLVAARAVLTARHCVSRTVALVGCPPQGPQIAGDVDPSRITVSVGDDVRTAVPVARGASLLVPPGDVLCGRDLAVLRLDRPVAGIRPLAVDRSRGASAGDLVRAVGFGRRGDHAGAGKKYARAHVRVLSAGASEFVVGEATCSGDSGGPAIDEATGAVVGVVSRGGPGCEGPWARNVYTRTDAFGALLREALRP